MLIICNGAYKSGSTWLFRIVQSMTGYGFIPEAYQQPGWNGLGIRPELLGKFLDQGDYASRDYILKGHFFHQRDLILRHTNLVVMNLRRDIRDVVVSAYYYEKMKGKHQAADFKEYYWSKGRAVGRRVIQYNRYWEGQPNTHMSSYEGLKSDFPTEVRKIAAFLGRTVDDAEIERIRTDNTLDSLKKKYDETSADGKQSFYRKGVVGDWQSHMDDAILADLQKIDEQQKNFPTTMDLIKMRVERVVGKLSRK